MADSEKAGNAGLTNRSVRERTAVAMPGGLVNGLRGRTNGLVNGLTNGMGRTNGLVNGRGRTKGVTGAPGRTNGLVTGLGYVNGVQLRRNVSGTVRTSDVRVAVYLIVASIVAMIVLGYFVGVPAPTPSPFQADGVFSEWASVPMYADEVTDAPPSADLVSFTTHWEPGRFAVYGRVRAPLFPGPNSTSVYLLIDDPASLGYRVAGFDVDYIAEFWGWGDALQDNSFREWVGDADRDNATSFRAIGTFEAASQGPEFEFILTDAHLDFDPSRDLRFRLATRDALATDETPIFGQGRGSLTLDQRAVASLVTSRANLLELRFRALVADVIVRNLTVDHQGGGVLVLPTLPLVISAGQERVEWAILDPTGLSPGAFVTVEVTAVDAAATSTNADVPVTVRGAGARTYVQAAPAGMAIDGVFSDWTSVGLDPDDAVTDSVDIRESALALQGDAFFYVRTEGAFLAGSILPERRFQAPPPAPNGSTPPPEPLRRQAAEDILWIYVDMDVQDATGMPFGGIIADRVFEVTGRAGRIISRETYVWNPNTARWDTGTGTLDVAFLGTQFEARAPASALSLTNNSRVVYSMTDWSQKGDVTDFLAPSPAPSSKAPKYQPTHGLNNQSVPAPPLVTTPTIDGRCGVPAGEYSGASGRFFVQLRFFVGRRDDTQFVFICIEFTADLTANGNDFGEILFDTKHNGGSAPQEDDRFFWVFSNSNSLGTAQGDGVGWNTCMACDPGNAARGRFTTGIGETYEFQIRYTDVWGSLSPPSDAVGGFMLAVYDFNLNVAYGWGSSNLSDTNPDTWGHILIPEFPFPAIVAGIVILIPIIWRRRRKAALEMAERYF